MKTSKEDEEEEKRAVSRHYFVDDPMLSTEGQVWYQSVLIKLIRFLTVRTHARTHNEFHWSKLKAHWLQAETGIHSLPLLIFHCLNGRFASGNCFYYSHIKFICWNWRLYNEKRVSHKDNKQQINVLREFHFHTRAPSKYYGIAKRVHTLFTLKRPNSKGQPDQLCAELIYWF